MGSLDLQGAYWTYDVSLISPVVWVVVRVVVCSYTRVVWDTPLSFYLLHGHNNRHTARSLHLTYLPTYLQSCVHHYILILRHT